MASGPIISWQIDGEKKGNSDFIFLLQNHCRRWLQPWNLKMLPPLKKSHDKPRQHIKKQRHYFCKGLSSQSYGLSSQIRSVAQSCLTLCDPMNHSTPGLPVQHQLPEFTETHVHRVGDAIQPSHPLSSPSPPAHNPSQHQSLFQWVNSSHEVAKVLEFQL